MNEYFESEKDLENPNTSLRLGALRNLRLKIQNGIPLPTDFASLSALFTHLKPRFSDSSPDVITQALLFTSDICKFSSQSSIDEEYESLPIESAIVLILPALVPCIGYPQQTVRKTALDTMRNYLDFMSNSGIFITCLIKYGIENDEWRIRKEGLDALTKLLTRDTGGFDQAHLVSSLISRLRDVSDVVVQQTIFALIHIKSLIGEDALLAYIRKLSGISRQLFRQYQGRIMGDNNNYNEGSNNGTLMTKKSTSKQSNSVAVTTSEIQSLSISGSPSITNLRIASKSQDSKSQDPSTVPNSPNLSKRSMSNSKMNSIPKSPNTTAKQETIHFGYISDSLYVQLLNVSDWKVRAQAIDNLFKITQEIANPELIKPELGFLLEMLSKFLQDSNFKVSLTSIYVLGQIIDIVGSSISPFVRDVSQMLILKLGDNKALIRQASMKIFMKLMQNAQVEPVIDQCLLFANHENPRVREEVVNLVSTALLIFPKEDFDFPALIRYLFNALKDTKAKIKFVSVEAFAIIATKISSERVLYILTDLGLDKETLELLKSRFNDIILPQLNQEGLVQHTISRSNAGTPVPSQINLAKETSKIFLSRANSRQDSFVKENVIKREEIQESMKPLEQAYSSLSHSVPDRPTEIKRVRSFSESDSALLPQDYSQQELPHSTDHSSETSIHQVKNQVKKTNIYAPDMKTPSKSSSLTGLGNNRTNFIKEDESPLSQSDPLPFSTVSKLRRTPPTVEENDGTVDKITLFSMQSGLDLPVSAPKEESFSPSKFNPSGISRNQKLVSAPPDRMRQLPNEEPDVSIEQVMSTPSKPKGRSKSSMDSPKLSIATKRRLEAKLQMDSQSQPSEAAIKEQELKQKRIVEQEFKDALVVLRANGEWNDMADALQVLSKVIATRPDLFHESLHEISLTVIDKVQNLRSSVSKSAISCLSDMFVYLGKAMDADLDITASALLKKLGEGGFIVDEVIKCLNTMVQNVTNVRVITALVGNADHKNPVIRLRVSILLHSIITAFTDSQASKYLSSIRDMEKLFPVLVKFLREGLADSRNSSKKTLYFLSKYQEFDKTAIKVLTNPHYREVQEAIAFIKNREDALLPSSSEESPSLDNALNGAISPLSRGKTVNKTMKSNSPLKQTKELKSDDFELHFSNLTADDWKIRSEAIENISKVILASPDGYSDRHTIQRVFDVFMERCRDGNSKVTCLALEMLSQLITCLKNALDPIVLLLVPILSTQMASSNSSIRKYSNDAFDKLLACTDSLYLAQSMTSIIQFGTNSKVKPIVLEKLVVLVNDSYAIKPGPIIKYVVPACTSLLRETKKELKVNNDKLILALHGQMGTLLFSYTGNATFIAKDKINKLGK